MMKDSTNGIFEAVYKTIEPPVMTAMCTVDERLLVAMYCPNFVSKQHLNEYRGQTTEDQLPF